MRSVSRRWLGLGLSSMLLLAACSGGTATTAPTTAPTEPPTTGPSASTAESTPAPTEMPGTKSFSIAFTSPGLSSAPFLAAIDNLNKNGYTITTQVIDQSELVTEGVSQGQFTFGSGANNSVLAAVEAGADLKAVASRVKNEWTMYATNDIQQCSDLDGKRVALHSQGAVSTAMVKNYIKENCDGTNPDYTFIEGSPNRVAALLAGQIDASPVELSDSFKIDAEAGDRFHLLASFAKDLPKLQTTSIYTNGTWAQDNPGSVVAVIKALLDVHKQIQGNPDYLKQIAQQYVADAISADTIDAAAKRYVELDMFPVDGGITADNLQYTAEFFGPDGTGATKTVIPLDQWTNLTYLQMATSGQ